MTKPLSTLTFPSCDTVAKLHFEGVRMREQESTSYAFEGFMCQLDSDFLILLGGGISLKYRRADVILLQITEFEDA